MTYVEDICLALIRVLEHASFHKDVRLAGYAANVDFWADEVRHALDGIAGYEARFEALKKARLEYAARTRTEVQPSWVTPTITADELAALRDRVRAAATLFFRLCGQYLDRDKAIHLEQLLGLRIENINRGD